MPWQGEVPGVDHGHTPRQSASEFKEKRSADTKRKIKLLLDRLQAFLERRSIFHIADVKLPDLSASRETWTSAATTRRRDQEILKSFFWYCDHSDLLAKNPVVHLDPILVIRSPSRHAFRRIRLVLKQRTSKAQATAAQASVHNANPIA
jgi:hypothetical protein